MSDIAREAVRLLEMLPEEDQRFACAFLKRLVRASAPCPPTPPSPMGSET